MIIHTLKILIDDDIEAFICFMIPLRLGLQLELAAAFN
jgi:hypothetical protein